MEIWDDILLDKDDNKIEHPCKFPIELTRRIIERFSKKGDLVLDPFAGSGTSLMAAKSLSRKYLGIELSENYVKVANARLGTNKVIRGSVFEASKYVNIETVDLIVTSPPYWDILTKIINYEPQGDDHIGKIQEYHEFLDNLKRAFAELMKLMKKGGKCVVVFTNMRAKGKKYSSCNDFSKTMTRIGFKEVTTIGWDRRREYMQQFKATLQEAREQVWPEFVLVFEKPNKNKNAEQ
ncbi:MAG: site-specific DNA-methyltransferase [Candidatus Altiarchaeota archaeon]|nr:site-specific DNA-methyltransferase [Candidatus Altiarchaeota archaeon]